MKTYFLFTTTVAAFRKFGSWFDNRLAFSAAVLIRWCKSFYATLLDCASIRVAGRGFPVDATIRFDDGYHLHTRVGLHRYIHLTCGPLVLRLRLNSFNLLPVPAQILRPSLPQPASSVGQQIRRWLNLSRNRTYSPCQGRPDQRGLKRRSCLLQVNEACFFRKLEGL